MFNEKDIEAITARGMTLAKVEQQINHFKKGFPYINLVKAATIGDGIIAADKEELDTLRSLYLKEAHHLNCIKFVPASGAASRMFSHLFNLLDELKKQGISAVDELEHPGHKMAREFFTNITQFAFYKDLEDELIAQGTTISKCLSEGRHEVVLDALLSEKGLAYANLPKGLLSFHSYENQSRKAVEEHLVEGALYCTNDNKEVYLHFTLSPEHIAPFEALLKKVIPLYESKYNVKYIITHSIQEPCTDIIAVDMENKPFRNADDSLLFRPGGHGALLNNLAALDADIIFIKNIDNVVHDWLKEPTVEYKQLLGGLLISIREKVFHFLEMLDDANVTQSELNTIRDFCAKQLMMKFPEEYGQFDIMEQIDYLYIRLNCPIRVCGMVKNEGEPGGGPFWVMDEDNEISLQIVESSQVNMHDAQQAAIFKAATHFNPVDLVCCIKDFEDGRLRPSGIYGSGNWFYFNKN